MHTIALAARKGGSGKTTVAAHLAVEAERCGAGPVTLIDVDPQQSLSAWWNDRSSETPRLMDVPRNRLRAEISQAAGAPGLVIIDTPPLDSEAITAVVDTADLILIPVKPSPHDLRGVSITVDLCTRSKKPFVFVLNQAIQRSSITQQALMALSQYGPVATSIIHNRVDYAGAMTDGRTAPELDPNGRAALEIMELCSYVFKQLRKYIR